ncbi:unnamed protein product [Diatraea saccharalis]|uniref:Uncharacterized protein n=1 Tax=Diatraea saccharalis TaxID=40085 RepID=A0A9P0CBN8_9NEOP|nr:unnamed protein product [Diatraea saccharalis]
MKLLFIIVSLAVIAFAENIEEREIDDTEAAATIELLRTPKESLETAASAYNYLQDVNSFNSQRNYFPQNTLTPDTNKNSAQYKYYAPPSSNYVPPSNNYVPPSNNYVPPTNNYVPPSNNYVPPTNNYVPPSNNYVPPSNNYVPPNNNYVPPQNNYVPPQNYYPSSTWTPPANIPSTTTPTSVIKNELSYGDNGSYKYEYQIADGTHVGEEGYYTDPKGADESLVKKGWYSYPGEDGKIYTVTYWADHTGFHATGDHLPTPPPVPPAIQAALDQQAKEEAAKAEAEKNKPSTGYYPNQPANYPNQPTYYPNQQSSYPNQQSSYPNQQTSYPNQQTYYPNQQNYYPNQPQYATSPPYGK